VAFAVIAALLLACLTTSAPQAATAPCEWKVTADRSAKPQDKGYEEGDPRLRDPDDPNSVAGPGSLVAVVKIDRDHRPHIYIEDRAAHTSKHLIDGSQPLWSPDGSRIACIVWQSRECMSRLVIVEVRSGKVAEPETGCNAVNYRWSPDSRSLAVAGVGKRDVNTLFWIDVPSSRVTVLDTLPVFADYEDLSWSPDSRALVATCITANDHVGIVFASDIWLFAADGQRCQLTDTKDFVEGEPKWIDAGRILYSRQPPDENGLGDSERRVLSVSRGFGEGNSHPGQVAPRTR
jgi:dipeptidyl aminopeptidase/acylaminoacyl peptidase